MAAPAESIMTTGERVVGSALDALRETGAVEWRGGRLTIKDWPKLSEIARFDPHYLHLRSVPEARRRRTA